MMGKLLGRFVILGVNREAQTYLKHCVVCVETLRRAQAQVMGPLPPEVVDHRSRPFAVIGIDFAGPFLVKIPKRKTASERYVLLITCMHTRAVHFETCPDMTAGSVALALMRFACLRGDPEVIFSDNQASLLLVRKEYLRQRPEGFEWKTITPRAPNQGGRWERMVQSMKRAIRSLAKSDLLNEEEFRTILARSAELLNSRPIVKNPKGDPHDALTPNHFIWGKDTYGHEGGQPRVKNLNAAFERMERIQTDLWKRFHSEVLLEGRGKNKWRRHQEGYEVGSLAIIIGDNPLQKTWLRGVITAVYPGEDGLIRNVAIRTPAGEFVRPSIKVIPIPRDPAFTIPSESESAGEDPDPDYPPSTADRSPERPLDSPGLLDEPLAEDLPEDSGLPPSFEDPETLSRTPLQDERMETPGGQRTPISQERAAATPPRIPSRNPDSTVGSPPSPSPRDRGPRRREEAETPPLKRRFRVPRGPDVRVEDHDPPPNSAAPRPSPDPTEEERLTRERRKIFKLQSRQEKDPRDSS
jgi:hypothetical protein